MPHQHISAAVADHVAWKAAVRATLVDGVSTEVIVAAARPDACAFGKWLASSSVSYELRHSPRFREAARLHAKFHDVARRTLLDVAVGNEAEVERSLRAGGAFTNATVSFTSHILAWQRELESAGQLAVSAA